MDQRIKLRIEYLRANLKYLNDVELAEYNRLTGQHLTHQQQHQQHTHQQVQETYQADQAYQSQQAYDQASNLTCKTVQMVLINIISLVLSKSPKIRRNARKWAFGKNYDAFFC